MAVTPRLDLRQTQTLVMTPQLQQAIKLLQLSNVELGDFVDRELERNPLLERDEGSEDAPATEDAATVPASQANGDAALLEPTGAAGGEAPLDVAPDDLYGADGESFQPSAPASTYEPGEASGPWGNGTSGDFEGEEGSLERTVAGQLTLRDHLIQQLQVDIADAKERMIGAYLIDNVDEAGYLRLDLPATAESLGCTLADLEAVLGKLQRFDPVGVFARDLKECLALQLAERDRLDPAMQRLLDNLDLIARHDNTTLLRRCEIDSDDLAEMLAELRSLDPKPGLRFDAEMPPPVVPDVFVRQHADGGWVVELNGETLPRVLVNERYYARVHSAARNKAEKEYLAEQLSTANWLVKSLDQRARTILRVAREIVRQQDAFLVHGVQQLRPLVLRNIADAVQMHESTISRVTTNKYMATPRGIFELKYFFTSAIASTEGEESFSAEAVRFRMKQLIDAEDAENVLSDDRLVELLRAEGVNIARRTIAKYREARRIASSVQRRREKKLFASA
jgi:RNA polymerase sigma-54 factor